MRNQFHRFGPYFQMSSPGAGFDEALVAQPAEFKCVEYAAGSRMSVYSEPRA
jgi:hypothetical protein